MRGMYAIIEQLERHFELLCEVSDETRRWQQSCDQCSDDLGSTQLASCASAGTTLDRSPGELFTQYSMVTMSHLVDRLCTSTPSLLALAHEIQFLRRQNVQLRKAIERNQHFQHRLRGLLDQLPPSVAEPLGGSHCSWHFVPLTLDECLQIIRDDMQQCLGDGKPDCLDDPLQTPLPLGWRGFVQLDACSLVVHFRMTKLWAQCPLENSTAMWEFMNEEGDTKHVYSDSFTHEILQRVSPDICILRRCVLSKEWTRISVMMNYRLRVGDSYLISSVPLPLWGSRKHVGVHDQYGESLLGEHETLAVCPLHHLLEPVEQDNGKLITRVFRWGSGACQVPEFAQVFVHTAIESAIRFEHLILAPVVTSNVAS